MAKKNKLLIIVIAGVIIISNLPPITYFLQEEYSYRNHDGSFQFSEQGGPTQGFDVAIARFESFKKKNRKNENEILYRNFRFKPWRFWEWWQMMIHWERYSLPKYK